MCHAPRADTHPRDKARISNIIYKRRNLRVAATHDAQKNLHHQSVTL
ncbi:hypothetical protein Y025_5456 [Burkholderia pseudomallei TSV32]|nr:hypothetical protein Y025_5456 [Burkholderia pseudomallei TSV32]